MSCRCVSKSNWRPLQKKQASNRETRFVHEYPAQVRSTCLNIMLGWLERVVDTKRRLEQYHEVK